MAQGRAHPLDKGGQVYKPPACTCVEKIGKVLPNKSPGEQGRQGGDRGSSLTQAAKPERGRPGALALPPTRGAASCAAPACTGSGRGDMGGRQGDLPGQGGRLARTAARCMARACRCLKNCQSFTR